LEVSWTRLTRATVNAHRPFDDRFHKLILQFDGQGSYAFGPLEWEKRLALQEEKQALEHKLLEIPKLQARLAELENRH
jgi:ATP-binding cassette subfamily D (ALD) long-chain fatty acid import protein